MFNELVFLMFLGVVMVPFVPRIVKAMREGAAEINPREHAFTAFYRTGVRN